MRLQTLYYEHYLSKDISLDDPKFHLASDVHDWRSYIGKYTAQIWNSFTKEQRAAIALDAIEDASEEVWT